MIYSRSPRFIILFLNRTKFLSLCAAPILPLIVPHRTPEATHNSFPSISIYRRRCCTSPPPFSTILNEARNWSRPENNPGSASDPRTRPQMIPGPEIIPRLYRKWSRAGNDRLAINSRRLRSLESGLYSPYKGVPPPPLRKASLSTQEYNWVLVELLAFHSVAAWHREE